MNGLLMYFLSSRIGGENVSLARETKPYLVIAHYSSSVRPFVQSDNSELNVTLKIRFQFTLINNGKKGKKLI